MKTKVDDLDVHKLKSLSAALSKLNNLVNNDVVQRTVYNKLVIKVSVIYIKTQTDKVLRIILEIDKKIPNAGGLVKKIEYSTRSQILNQTD